MNFDPRLFDIEADIWKAAMAASLPLLTNRMPSEAVMDAAAVAGDRAVEAFRKRVDHSPFDPSIWDAAEEE